MSKIDNECVKLCCKFKVASSKPSGGAKGNAKGSNKDKNSSGNIYSVKHNRIKEGQRETRKSAPKK